MDDPYKITVLRSDEQCVEGDTCPVIARLNNDSEVLHLVARPETDPAKVAAFGSRIGSGELLVTIPATLLPEVT